MKVYFSIIISLLLLMTSCQIREDKTAKPTSNSGKESFKDHTTVEMMDTAYDFGTVKEGELVTYNYKFKNTGKNPLIVTNAVASCGCTVPEKPDHPIAPGEMGFIKVKFDSDRRPGTAHKTITVFSNADPEFPELKLTGTVIGID